jgi:Raf kinase inhibitor-like YbhB/YbcL family protein
VPLSVVSPSFKHTQMIPGRHTGDGEDLSPPLSWSGSPPRTASLVLVCVDPDAPGGEWTHWVLFDLPAGSPGLPEGVPPTEHLAAGGVHGRNSWGRLGWGGPCPPSGVHRYFFRLYALECRLGLGAGATKAAVLEAARGHVLTHTELMGRYKRR